MLEITNFQKKQKKNQLPHNGHCMYNKLRVRERLRSDFHTRKLSVKYKSPPVDIHKSKV